jgi:hypothetical protein
LPVEVKRTVQICSSANFGDRKIFSKGIAGKMNFS